MSPTTNHASAKGYRSTAEAVFAALVFVLVFVSSMVYTPAATVSTPSSSSSSSSSKEPVRTQEGIAAAREYFLMAREADRVGDPATALSWYALAFRHDAGSRDLCFLYLERLKDAGAVDSSVAVAKSCLALAGGLDTVSAIPSRPRRGALVFVEHKLLGEVALRAEDSKRALFHYRQAHRLNDEDGDVLYVLAGLNEEAGEWEAHAENVRALLPRLGYPPRLIERLARTYVRLERGPEIIPVIEEAWEETGLPLYGQSLAAHYESAGLNLSLLKVARALATADSGIEREGLLARAYAMADRPDSALLLTTRLLRREPDDAGLRFMHASLLFERGRYKEAAPFAAALAKESPEVAAYHFLEGSALLESKARPARTRAALDKALALSPFSPEYRARRAYAELVWRGKKSSAFDPPDPAASYANTDSLPEEQRLMLAGLVYGRLAQELVPREVGQRSAVFSDSAASRRYRHLAVERYDSILSKNSGHRAALFEAGAHRERLGDLAGAKALLRRLVARDTSHALGMNYLAYTLIEQDSLAPGELEEAGRLLERALSLDPENGAYLDSRGWWHHRKGEHDSAVTWLKAAVDAVPDDPAILDHLVKSQTDLGQRDEACAVLHRLSTINPKHRSTLECPDVPDRSAPVGP